MPTKTNKMWRVASVRNLQWDEVEDPAPHRVLDLEEDDKPQIELTEKEQKIFSLLREVLQHFKLKTTLRVAGGWVRNKLLKKEGKDIDIAIDDMMGSEMAKYVTEYQQLKGMPTRSVGIVKANPDQSKHLETATTHIFDEPIDFVNLRSETYSEHSRIPVMELGSPEEDARRRDLTVNALFYNINTSEVEDFTGNGLEDLKKGVIQTPLPPFTTFMDDPLRILRCVRFACQFHFEVSPEIIESTHKPEVKEALNSKVSRERVGIELFKIVCGDDPVGGFALFEEMDILSQVFTFSFSKKRKKKHEVEYNPTPASWTKESWNAALARMRCMYKEAHIDNMDQEQRGCLLLAAFMSTIHDRDNFSCLEDAKTWCQAMLVHSFKLPLRVSNNVAALLYGAEKLLPLIRQISNLNSKEEYKTAFHSKLIDNSEQQFRLFIGLWIREIKELWEIAAVLSSVIDKYDDGYDRKQSVGFVKAVREAGLSQVYSMKPILKGNEIASALNVKGRQIGTLTHELLKHQISSVSSVSKEEALTWLKENKDKLLSQ